MSPPGASGADAIDGPFLAGSVAAEAGGGARGVADLGGKPRGCWLAL